MPISARKAAGIIRNVLPKRVIERPPRPAIVGSREELIHRRIQIRIWEAKKAQLMKTKQGRQYLARHFPASFQKALLAKQSPGSIKSPRSAYVRRPTGLNQLHPMFHSRIMRHMTPKLPAVPPFPVGKKKVYLPNIIVTLKRNPKFEPYYAVFEVPLNISKLDLRDYLWHLYDVKVLSVRSLVLPGQLRRKHKVEDRPVRLGPMIRTRARKKMIVQLAKPFQYPPLLSSKELNEQFAFSFKSMLIAVSRRTAMKLL